MIICHYLLLKKIDDTKKSKYRKLMLHELLVIFKQTILFVL